MAQKDLRTYRRRETTRESGYHTCEETTGGECKIYQDAIFDTKEKALSGPKRDKKGVK